MDELPILNAIKDMEKEIRGKLDIFNNSTAYKFRNNGWYSKDLTPEENTILNIRLVVYVVDKFKNTMLKRDDMISAGMEGLIKAVNTFDNKRNIKFATYAATCIRNEILMLLRRERKHNYNISMEEEIYIDHNGNVLTLEDKVSRESDLTEKQFEIKCLIEDALIAMNDLSNLEREVIEHRFGLNGKSIKTQRQLKPILGVSQSYISRLEKSGLRKIKRILEAKPTTLIKPTRRVR